KRAYCLKTQPATGETYPKSDLFNKAEWMMIVTSGSRRWLILFAHMAVISSKNLENFIQRFLKRTSH
ncbi:hypothetical protein ACH674_00175, partial [Klebsiella pneumoniae]